jgi:hypothetical protein
MMSLKLNKESDLTYSEYGQQQQQQQQQQQ